MEFDSGWECLPDRSALDTYSSSRRRQLDGLDGQYFDGTIAPSNHSFPRPRSKDTRPLRRMASWIQILCLCLAVFVASTDAAFIKFENCLDPSVIDSNPVQLQFKPLYFWAALESVTEAKNLNITVYGNVTGIATREPYPAPGDPAWSNPNVTTGKIPDLNVANNKLTTLLAWFDVLSFTPYNAPPSRFCDSMVQGECPVAPVFNANGSDPSQLRAFSISHGLTSSYSFTSLAPTLKVVSGNAEGTLLGCITAEVTPNLGMTLTNVIRFVPLAILILVGIATISAAVYSPWGSTDHYRWTSNYGRDEDLLRLVTPGFGDCLQYIQFIVLTGSLTLNYPGFYQPIVSKATWSTLMFNQSYVSHGVGMTPMEDGVYTANATYGLDRMRQLVGMSSDTDIWAGMVIYMLIIIAYVVILTNVAWFARWLYRKFANVPEEDLESKDLPLAFGNFIRVVFIYFLLPLVSSSMFQLVIARHSPIYTVVLAVFLLLIIIAFTTWLLIITIRTRPKSYLFDDFPTVLLYGPLYNTYSDDAAAFSVISVGLMFVRGIAIGAVQPSGIAQLVLLAICEVVMVLTLTAFQPFPSPTSMNLYHGCFAFVRFITILMSIAFAPSLSVSAETRGWLGYVILLLHAMVLVFGFFLNAIQTLIEVIARLAGAGGEGGVEGGAARGGLVKVFGMRQLSRRVPRNKAPRHSGTSQAAILGADLERMSTQLDGSRPRSLSGSSALLLGRSGGPDSLGLEGGSSYGAAHSRSGSTQYTPTTPGGISAFSHAGTGHHSGGSGSPRAGVVGFKHEPMDPYYRPPRQRRATLDGPSSSRHRSGLSISNIDDEDPDQIDGPSAPGGDTPTPAYLRAPREDPDADGDDAGRDKTDYAVREVDFYYRVRGPALSKTPTRKLKTGPADPTGPVSSATGWFRGLFGGKTKDKAKGFEVVRSARAPPPGLIPVERDEFPERYEDEPDNTESAPLAGPANKRNSDGLYDYASDDPQHRKTVPADPPSLPPIEAYDAIELPSRTGSKKVGQRPTNLRIRPPTIPRKSSKRQSGVDTGSVDLSHQYIQSGSAEPARLPFASKPSSTKSDHVSGSTRSSLRNVTDDEVTTPRRPSDSQGRRESDPSHGPARNEPAGVKCVHKHRTSDNIHETSPEEIPLSGSSAEFVEGPPR